MAVIMGGYSSEFEISIQSGTVVSGAISKDKYQVYPVHILKNNWFYKAENGTEYSVNRADFSFSDGKNTIKPDVVYNTIHGTPGEDGLIQAYFRMLNIPQTSSPFYPSALTFNKRDCLSVLKNFGVRCANSYYINQGDDFSIENIIKIVGLPCFVKPSKSGSSFGISKVNTIEEFDNAFEKAYKEDHEILIETALVGTEVSVGAMRANDGVFVFPPTEIVSENEFFDYEAKYLGKSQEITPARISEIEIEKVQLETKRIYQILNLCGIARADFIIQEGEPFFIEVNTNPGLSTESIVPKQAASAGISLTELFDNVIEYTLENS